jgi:catechol 2,3-dioxygenase
MTPEMSIDPGVKISHVHLKVRNLERTLHFCRDVLDSDLTQRMGDSASLVTAGGYHCYTQHTPL